MICDQRELAEFFDVSPRTIRNWQAEGMPCEGNRQERKYDTADCIAWFAVHRGVKGAPISNGGDPDDLPTEGESDRRWKAARATLQQLEVEQRKGRLVPEEVFMDVLKETGAAIRGQLLSIPARVAYELAAISDVKPERVREVVMESVRDTLEALQKLPDEAQPEPST